MEEVAKYSIVHGLLVEEEDGRGSDPVLDPLFNLAG